MKSYVVSELKILLMKNWYENRFKHSVVLIDEDEYAKMCIDALKTAPSTAPTDFGSSGKGGVNYGQI